MSSKPEQFIMSSDFASLKNDDGGTVSVTIPGGQTVAAASKFTVSSDITIGTQNASLRSQVTSSKLSSATYVTHQIYFIRSGTVAGFPANYDVYAYVTRPTATTLRATAVILNPYGDTLTGEAGDETFTFNIKTFLSPHQ